MQSLAIILRQMNWMQDIKERSVQSGANAPRGVFVARFERTQEHVWIFHGICAIKYSTR